MVTITILTTRAAVKDPEGQNMHLPPVREKHISFLVEVTREVPNFKRPTVLL
jgi:hypothetical protein